MNKLYTLAAAAVFGTMAVSAATMPVVFNGTDSEGWTYGDNAVIEKGHLDVTMTNQGTEEEPKYRQDLAFKSADEAGDYTFDAAEMKYLAIKFIGARPNGNMTLEMKDRNTGAWLNSKWKNRPDGSFETASGNTIYYYDLTKDEAWTGTVSAQELKFKIADCKAAPFEYSVDWIQTFPTLEAVQASADWKDDGDADADEADQPVMIGSTGYSSISEALAAAVDGDVILINKDQNITSRLSFDNAENLRNVTVRGNAEGVKITHGVAANSLMVLSKVDGNVLNFENILFDGMSNEATACSFEASATGRINFTNCTFQNFSTTNSQGVVCAKNNGNVSLNNVVFTDCTVPEERGLVFLGCNGSSVSGNNTVSIYLENKWVLRASELAQTAPITLYVEIKDGGKAVGDTVVEGCSDPSMFTIANQGYELAADGDAVKLILAISSGIGAIEAGNGAEAEYYTLGGVRVAPEALSAGIYIYRKGNAVTKVAVR